MLCRADRPKLLSVEGQAVGYATEGIGRVRGRTSPQSQATAEGIKAASRQHGPQLVKK